MEEKYARRDIAELLRKEKELEGLIKAQEIQKRTIEQAKQECSNIIDSIPDFIALIDKDHTIIRLNMSMAKAFGMHPREIVGRKCFELCHKSGKIPKDCPHKKLLKDGKIHSHEIFEKNLGGYIEVITTPYLDPDGSLIGSVHVVRNINKRKTAENEKNQVMVQLLSAQKLEAVGRLAAGIAHEINTPTQYVASNLDFFREAFEDISCLFEVFEKVAEEAEREGFSQESIKEMRKALEEADWDYLREEVPKAVEQAQEGVARVTKIVRAMKDFSHPGSKEKALQDINKIIETTVTIAKNEWKYSSDVVLHLLKELPPVPCLSDEIGQVILNLLVNAAQAISEKLGRNPEGVKGKITITTREKDNHAAIVIEDTGTGIPEEIRDKIFEPFFTTKEVGKGTGQGLSIARDIIVKKHGGTIEVDSTPGEGTRFRITLPIAGHDSK